MTDFQGTHAPRRSEHPHSRYAIDCAGAWLYVHARNLATVLRVDGEIDASNAQLVVQTLRQFARLNAPVIVDLSELDFLGIAGFRELLDLHHEHAHSQLRCTVIGGAALRRLTRIFTDHGLTLFDSVPAALHSIDQDMRDRRRVVSGLARQLEPQRAAHVLRKFASEG
jgi:anti-anti-sigma factor